MSLDHLRTFPYSCRHSAGGVHDSRPQCACSLIRTTRSIARGNDSLAEAQLQPTCRVRIGDFTASTDSRSAPSQRCMGPLHLAVRRCSSSSFNGRKESLHWKDLGLPNSNPRCAMACANTGANASYAACDAHTVTVKKVPPSPMPAWKINPGGTATGGPPSQLSLYCSAVMAGALYTTAIAIRSPRDPTTIVACAPRLWVRDPNTPRGVHRTLDRLQDDRGGDLPL